MPCCTEFRLAAWRFSSGSAPRLRVMGWEKSPLGQVFAPLLQLPQGQHLPHGRPQNQDMQRQIHRQLCLVEIIRKHQQLRRHKGDEHRGGFPGKGQAQHQHPQVPPGPDRPPAQQPQQPQHHQVRQHHAGLAPGRERQDEQVRQGHEHDLPQDGRGVIRSILIDQPLTGQGQHKHVQGDPVQPGQVDALMARPMPRRRQREQQRPHGHHRTQDRHHPQPHRVGIPDIVKIYHYQLTDAVYGGNSGQRRQQEGQGLGPYGAQELFHCAVPSILYPFPQTTFRYRGSAGLISIFSRMCRTWTATGLSAAGSSCHTRR